MTDPKSDCCGAEPEPIGRFGVCPEDLGICPQCYEHCEYVDEDDE